MSAETIKKIVIYGASDDLIEIEGDLEEEFSYYGEDSPATLLFSDGTIAAIIYGSEGIWRITPVVKGPAFERIDQCAKNEGDNYSDRLYMAGNIKWVGFIREGEYKLLN